MWSSQRPWPKMATAAFLLTVLAASSMAAVAQSAPVQKKPSPTVIPQESQASSKEEEIEALRSKLLELLRSSPKLTMAISSDPTLLADEPYVSRNNPELADFLHTHPEVARNPEFYLFFPDKFSRRRGRQRFEATVWPELQGSEPPNNGWDAGDITLFLVFVLLLGGLLWISRLVLEHVKWNKLSKMQNELYSKLLDKCSTNEELLASFRSAGKPLFDLAAIEPRSSNPMTRVFLPLQFGIVLAFASGGLYVDQRFVILGALALTLGIGFIVSAAASYLLARHLGLLPWRGKANEASTSEGTASS